MAASTNHKPKGGLAPVVVQKDYNNSDGGKQVIRLIPAIIASLIFHGILIALGLLLSPNTAPPQLEVKEDTAVNADPVEEKPSKDPFLTTDVDPAAQEFDQDINYNVDRKADVSVPGTVNPNEAIGIADGDRSAAPINLPAPGGFGNKGQGGALEGLIGTTNAGGEIGGYGPRGMALAGSFYGRSGATREKVLREGGGTGPSEAAVAGGLKWLVKQQNRDGSWSLQGKYPDKGNTENETAGTAFGLLPLLGAGKTHKTADKNPFNKPILDALMYLIGMQDRKTGNLDKNHNSMYAHGLATIALCEAYGLTQDQMLRRPAQMALGFIVNSQHDGGGWRYSPKTPGDLSVSGWMIMALKSGQMSGLDVPDMAMRKAQRYLDASVGDPARESYTYTPDSQGGTPTMTAVGLLCRQYLQSWGPNSPRLIKGVQTNIIPTPPGRNSYYYYYATQVMHHFGGKAWKDWNEKMREQLVTTQVREEANAQFGSWSSVGDGHGAAGGRLMVTSLNLLTLEVYYRHLPLYYRETGVKKDDAVKNAVGS